MAEATKISWCHHTFNLWMGCTKVSAGCANCYAEKLVTGRMGKDVWGPGKARQRTTASYWRQLKKWHDAALAAGERRRVFIGSLMDWADPEAPAGALAEYWPLAAECWALDLLMLTKRPERVDQLLPAGWAKAPWPHVWLGISCEDQANYDKRWPALRCVPAAVRFISYEPALGPLRPWPMPHRVDDRDAPDWLIAGGESDPNGLRVKAREFDLAWAFETKRWCYEQGTAWWFKQLGSNPVQKGQRWPIKSRAGTEPAEWPSGLRLHAHQLPRPRDPVGRVVTMKLAGDWSARHNVGAV